MTKIVSIKPSNNVISGLRALADQIESGEIEVGNFGLTVVTGGDVFHLGTHDDDQAASNAVFSMNLGILKLTQMALDEE